MSSESVWLGLPIKNEGGSSSHPPTHQPYPFGWEGEGVGELRECLAGIAYQE